MSASLAIYCSHTAPYQTRLQQVAVARLVLSTMVGVLAFLYSVQDRAELGGVKNTLLKNRQGRDRTKCFNKAVISDAM